MPTTSKRHFVGQLQSPNAGPEDIELIIQERADISSSERDENIEWVDSRYDPGDVQRYGAVPEAFGTIPIADSSAAFRNAVLSGHKILIPEGAFRILPLSNVGLSITGTNVFQGSGRWKTELWFDTAVESDVFIDLTETSTRSQFRDMRFRVSTKGKATWVRIVDNLAQGSPNWKNTFENIRCDDFFIGQLWTTDDPLTGTTHSHVSETMLLHSKIKNCRTGILIQNSQSVNNALIQTDIENDDAGETYTLIRDEAGGGINLYGSSLIGKGLLYDFLLPAGFTSLWQSGYVNFDNCRIEARSVHKGQLFNQNTSWSGIGSAFVKISMRDTQIQCNNQTIDLLKYGGRLNATFDNLDVLSGTLNIRLFPTDGFTSSSTVGSLSSVHVENSPNVFYEQETSSPYGTYDVKATGEVNIKDSHHSSGGTMLKAADNFRSIVTNSEVNVIPRALGISATPKRMIFNEESLTAGFKNIEAILPKFARPIKLFIYKQPQKFTNPIAYKLYLVKDNADWAVPGTFAVGTDAVAVADTGSTVNKAGYFEINVELVNDIFGNRLQAGFESWLEGRIFFEHSGSAENFIGFVGVEYL